MLDKVKDVFLYDLMPDSVRLYIKRNTVLFKLVSNFLGANVVDSGTQICLDGAPRSANTFAYRMLKSSNPELNISHHGHSVANIKLALMRDVPTFILIREPVNEIVSNAIRIKSLEDKTYDEGIRYSIKQYNQYYEFVSKHLEGLKVIDFNTVVNNPKKFLNIISSDTSFSITIPDEINKLEDDIIQEIKKESNEKGENFRKKASTIPSEEREKLKEKVREIIEKNYRKELNELEEIYQSIKNDQN